MPIFKESMLTQVALNKLAWQLSLINQVK